MNVIENIKKSEDLDALKNTSLLLWEYIKDSPCNERKFSLAKSIISEISDCTYNEELSNMFLCLIGELHCVTEADLVWREENKISRYDWRVLWGEMSRIHKEKIKRWFPKITNCDLRNKIYDECIAFLRSGHTPLA